MKILQGNKAGFLPLTLLIFFTVHSQAFTSFPLAWNRPNPTNTFFSTSPSPPSPPRSPATRTEQYFSTFDLLQKFSEQESTGFVSFLVCLIFFFWFPSLLKLPYCHFRAQNYQLFSVFQKYTYQELHEVLLYYIYIFKPMFLFNSMSPLAKPLIISVPWFTAK